jgi:zinc transporter ZupT
MLLVDAIGALVSTVSLGVLLPYFQSFIGLPLHLLYVLAFIAAIFCIISLSSFFRGNCEYQKRLKMMAKFNLLYILVTWLLIILYFAEITNYGLLYFAAETIVVLVLLKFERQLAVNSP